ncbi:hypothetical protein [Nocardia wallacei]|uniref:hypothetical protein n=1 Tax=Nocardia wallacei TaxID=480035 RepID=UPI002453767C|nr:hypothetical protein [Nocardia wallacei]
MTRMMSASPTEAQVQVDQMAASWTAVREQLAADSRLRNGEPCCCMCRCASGIKAVPRMPGVFACIGSCDVEQGAADDARAEDSARREDFAAAAVERAPQDAGRRDYWIGLLCKAGRWLEDPRDNRVQIMVAATRDGVRCVDIAAALGMHDATVRWHLKKAGMSSEFPAGVSG